MKRRSKEFSYMPEMLMEQGQCQCVNYKAPCYHRSCTAAQGCFCCKECEYNKTCDSKCKRK